MDGTSPDVVKAEPIDHSVYSAGHAPNHALKPDPERDSYAPIQAVLPLGSGLRPNSGPAPEEPPQPQLPKIQLSEEQRAVVERVKRGENVFFTGSAGTGKSVLLREIIRTCREDGRPGKLAVTASTGIASVNIGGTTLHSWAGIGLGKEPADKLVGKLLGQEKWRKRQEMARRQDMDVDEDEDDKDPFSPAYNNDGSPRTVEKWKTVRTLIIDESVYFCSYF